MLKLFSVVTDWFTGWAKRLTANGSVQLANAFREVERVAAQSLPVVQWVGDVVVTAIQSSHLPVADILAIELRKMCPDLPDIEKQAGRLAVKDRPDMLLSLAVLVLQYMGAGSVKLSILRAAIEIAHLIYSAEKSK
jgi:hypothetical protein